jgi:cbb3-type cytochrome oxidase subunit 3
MIQQVLKSFPLTDLTAFGLLLFLATFCGVLAWVFRKGSRSFYQELSMLPIRDEREVKSV